VIEEEKTHKHKKFITEMFLELMMMKKRKVNMRMNEYE